jgi:hypothetical protein
MRRPNLLAAGVVVAISLVLGSAGEAPNAQATSFGSSCGATINPIVCENAKPGNPQSEWDIDGAGDPTIQGFATDMSIDHGQTVHFKVDTNASAYRIDIYRLGWYGGNGARKVAEVLPSASLPQSQPACLTEAATGLVDCGNWAESASWDVPADAPSGIYIGRLVRLDTLGASHIVFVVRDDEGQSDVLVQTSDTTWQAYNQYGGNSLYVGSPANRAYKVSYNRPFTTRAYQNVSFLFSAEYPMVRWLERNGYDVSYFTGVDTDRRGAELVEHKVFMPVGHDEYWSAQQRANVEAARAAGVDLAFFTGNEIYWKTRWEPSIDGSSMSHRTLVTYKETKANAKIDPDPAWTGTWRDPRFSPPGDGGRPENALTGTIFTVDAYREDSIKVPSADGKMRFWRNTSVANLSSGATATLPAGTLGHEWDEDLDNGFRPAGLFGLSTTTLTVAKHLVDNGNTFVSGSATHHLTLYRAASGALVFGAGTCQWAWGLDSLHDVFSSNPPRPPDSRMQQATVNLLADMGVQAATLQSGLVSATASSDATPPTSTVTSPSVGSTVQSGSTVTVTGTAADAGGGRVAGVEVSFDGGTTWHPASGRGSWTYSWNVSGAGPVTIKTRAADDSGNLEAPLAGTSVTVACPCRLWANSAKPGTASSSDTKSVEVGVKFQADTSGYVTGMRFYRGTKNTGTHTASLWTRSGQLLARAQFTGESASGWQEVTFDAPVPVSADTTYVASYYAPQGAYSLDTFYFGSGLDRLPLHALKDGLDGGNGVYKYGPTPTFPTESFAASNYWVDVVFYDSTPPPDTTPPRVTATAPAAGATNADARGDVTVTFSEAIDPSTVTTETFELRDAANVPVAATVSYGAAGRTATLHPTAPLAYSATYTATVHGGPAGVKDVAGNPVAADVPWTFTTAAPRTCPCNMWGTTKPGTPSSADTKSVEVGVKFRSDLDGWISGIRFYKGSANKDTHVGSLWTSTGKLVARATFTGETGSGWQAVTLDGPVAVTADTTYVASYHANTGGYALDVGYFDNTYANPPLRALRDGLDGGNGVYKYGSTPTFPTEMFGASNYWVDVVFNSTKPADTRPPRVTETSPAASSADASAVGDVTASFSEPMNASTITGTTFLLKDPANAVIPATVTYDPLTQTATLDPTASLAYGTLYTATVTGGSAGVKDGVGNALASSYTWSFTTKSCPCSLFAASARPTLESSSDSQPVELGVRFRTDAAGSVTGVRFYKGGANTGLHVGSLWSNDGTLLARGTFTSESASGWQTVTFAVPVEIGPGTTYVASYYAPAGGYSFDGQYFRGFELSNPPLRGLADGFDGANGVYAYAASPTFPLQTFGSANYWVDVLFLPSG